MTFHTELYIKAAKELELKVDQIDSNSDYYFVSKNNIKIPCFQNKLGVNNYVSSIMADNKYSTNTNLQKHGIKIPQGQLFKVSEFKNNPDKVIEEIINYSKTLKDCVIKPNIGTKGNGVFIKPKTEEEITFAVKHIFALNKAVLVEKFIQGNHYRVLIARDEIIDVVHRMSAFVIGDGVTNVENLIKNKNKIRVQNELPEIIIDTLMIQELDSKNINLSSIIANNEELILNKISNVSSGGEPHRIELENIPQYNKDLFIKIKKASNLDYIGIDLICEDITSSLDEYAVNEVNKSPMIKMHSYLDKIQYGENTLTAKRILSNLVS